MDKNKLRPATPADLVKGNRIIVEDTRGVFIESAVVLTLSDQDTGDVFIPDDHSLDGVTLENPNTWIFNESDFEDGRHGDYGLKLWVQKGKCEMDKSKLRPATPADLVEGNKITVEDAVGAFVNGTVIQALDANVGVVYVHGAHTYTYRSRETKDVEEDYSWSFVETDFEDGRHGDYGLKLWVQIAGHEAPVAWLLTNANGAEVITRDHPGEWPGATVEPLYRKKAEAK